MKTKEELRAMSHEELVQYVLDNQYKIVCYDSEAQKNARLKEYLSAVGIIIDSYKNECK